MREDLDYAARRVFAEFIEGFEQQQGRRGWAIRFDAARCARMDLTPGIVRGALTRLMSEDLIKMHGTAHTLTDQGYRACVHRELIDQALGSPATARGLSLQVVAQQVVIGNSNTLQVNSDEVITKLVAHISNDAAIEPEKKKRWLEVLKDVGSHIAAEGLKVLIDKAVGK